MRPQRGERIDLEVILHAEDVWDTASFMMHAPPQRKIFCTGYVYRRNQDDPLPFYTGGNHRFELHGHISHIIRGSSDFDPETDYGLFEVHPNPSDLEQKAIQGFVLEDREVKKEKSLMLLDVEFYSNTEPMRRPTPQPSDAWREVALIDGQLRRHDFLRQVELLPFCVEEPGCLVQMQGIPWRNQDHHIWHIFDGAFAEVKILNAREDVPVHVQWRFVQQGCELNQVRELWRAEQQTQRDQSPEPSSYSEDEEDGSLQIFSRPLTSSSNLDRLPPPGNGMVAFEEKVEMISENEREQWTDRAISNPFIEGMIQQVSEDRAENPFFQDFCFNLRFGRTSLAEENYDEAEQPEEHSQQHFLPLIHFESDENPIGETDEGDKCEENDSSKRDGLCQKVAISLENQLGDYETFLPVRIEETKPNSLDMNHIVRFEKWFSNFLTIPNFENQGFQWKTCSQQWIDLPQWITQPAESLHFYVDGSKSQNSTGAGVVLFVFCQGQWHYGGYIYHSIKEDGKKQKLSAYEAELMASSMASKWAFDEIRLQENGWNHVPEIHFHYDAWAATLGAIGEISGDCKNPFFMTA